MITLKTDNPVAIHSEDHIFPWGTKRDNSTNVGFIDEILEYNILKGKDSIKFLDLGCAGGQLAIDVLNRGHLSVGLEGSDYNIKHKRANWKDYSNKNLFTCDVTKPYELFNNNKPIQFDTITAWEVVEHIKPQDLKMFFKQINDNLCPGGFFCGSISYAEDAVKDENREWHVLHQTVWDQMTWNENFNSILKETDLEVYDYPFINKVRNEFRSFFVLLEKKLK